MPEQRIAKRNAIVIVISAIAVVSFVAVFVVYGFSASRERGDIRTELKEAVATLTAVNLKTAEDVLKACQLNNAARMQSNRQIRRPLKEMLGYIVELIDASLERSASSGKPIPDLTRTLAIRSQFDMFERQVVVLKPINCKAP